MNCGKTADFDLDAVCDGDVVGREMGVLDGVHIPRRRASFGGGFDAGLLVWDLPLRRRKRNVENFI